MGNMNIHTDLGSLTVGRVLGKMSNACVFSGQTSACGKQTYQGHACDDAEAGALADLAPVARPTGSHQTTPNHVVETNGRDRLVDHRLCAGTQAKRQKITRVAK